MAQGLIEHPAKRVLESGGPTVLTVGAVGAGQVVGRSGTSLVGVNAVIDNVAEVYDFLSGTKLYIYDAAALAAKRFEISTLISRGYIDGLTLSNNSTDPTNDIDVAEGIAGFQDLDFVPIGGWFGGTTKRLDALFSAGSGNGMRDTGSIADGWWHIFLIGDSSNGQLDILASLSATAPTMPGTFDRWRRIGAILRASSVITPFSQVGDNFLWLSPPLDINVTNLGTTAVLYPLTVPTGVKVWAQTLVRTSESTSGYFYLTSPDQTDEAAGNDRMHVQGNSIARTAQPVIRTDTSARIRAVASGANLDLDERTTGWFDPRGRDVA